MLYRAESHVLAAGEASGDVQEIETQHGPALNYVSLTGTVLVGQRVLLNRTARRLNLGTGGYDFVMANISALEQDEQPLAEGHIIKARYTPSQLAVQTLEEQAVHSHVWQRRLDAFPVIVGQLHSQLAPVCSALHQAGARTAYVMTDGAALAVGFSRLVHNLKESGCLQSAITAGQAFGGDHETITVASALLAARHILECDAAVVIQGPGNAGSGTRYGFSGIEQASHLNTAAALGATPIALVRMSSADERRRHQGISHHTITALEMTLTPCDVPVPAGVDASSIPNQHVIREVDGTADAISAMAAAGIAVTSMGRTPEADPLFFQAAAAAGLYAATLISKE